MERAEFSRWLGEIGRLSAAQRLQALASLSREESGKDGGGAGSGAAGGAAAAREARSWRRRRGDDALGEVGHGKVESQGCPHCAGRDVVGWGRSSGLARYRCKDCARTFNALTKTPMARLR